MTAENREAYRAAFLAEQLALVPPGYSPVAHLSISAGIGLAAVLAGYFSIDVFHWPHLAVAATFFVLANLVEWWAHKHLLHRRQRFLEPLYDQHVPRHHVFYVESRMAVASRREWGFVLMPKRGVLAIAVMAIPLALLVWAIFGSDYGWVAIMTVGSYASFYEVTHLCYHLPKEHFLQRIGLIRWLSRHHARHHNQSLMNKWNFNVTVPLWDFLLGTNHKYPKPRPEP